MFSVITRIGALALKIRQTGSNEEQRKQERKRVHCLAAASELSTYQKAMVVIVHGFGKMCECTLSVLCV